MSWLWSIAEERIREAIERGEFDRLPGFGKPLPPDDAEGVPEELRLSFRILRNAGMLPEEMQLRKEMLTLEDLIRCTQDEAERKRLNTELTVKRLRYRALMEQRGWRNMAAFADYAELVERRLVHGGRPQDEREEERKGETRKGE